MSTPESIQVEKFGDYDRQPRRKSSLLCGCRVCIGDAQIVSELSKLSCQVFSPVHEGLRLRTNAVFDVIDAFVQDLPDHPADPMSDGPYG